MRPVNAALRLSSGTATSSTGVTLALHNCSMRVISPCTTCSLLRCSQSLPPAHRIASDGPCSSSSPGRRSAICLLVSPEIPAFTTFQPVRSASRLG